MSSSNSPSRTSTDSCFCPKKEPEVTLDDVAAVVADLNSKVLQLRKEIHAFKDCSSSEKSKRRAGRIVPETAREKLTTRQPKQQDYQSQLIRNKNSNAVVQKDKDFYYPTSFPQSKWSPKIQTEAKPPSTRNKNRNVSFAPRRPQKNLSIASNSTEEFGSSDDESTTGKSLSDSSVRIRSIKSKDSIVHETSSQREKRRQKTEKPLSNSSDEKKYSNKLIDDTSYTIINERKKPIVPKFAKSSNRYVSDEVDGYALKNKASYTISSANKTNGDTKTIEKSTLKPSKYEENHIVSLQNRKEIHKKDDRFRIKKSIHSKKNIYIEDDAETFVKHESHRIALPSRVSLKCQGIRHAFGLTNAYCNCDFAGSAVRRVRRKKISRGVQCDLPKKSKCVKYCGLGGCFGFKRYSKKSKGLRRKNDEKNAKKGKSEESLEVYSKKLEPFRKMNAIEENVYERNYYTTKENKNRRMGGGAEKIRFRGFESTESFVTEKQNSGERCHRRETRKKEAVIDSWVQKNDVNDVKRRLNECLVELNEIVGDVGLIFEEKKKKHSCFLN